MRWPLHVSPNRLISALVLVSMIVASTWLPKTAEALLPLPPNPQNGSVGIEGTIPSPAPTQAATIAVPGNGQVFTSTPITVSGLCPKGLLVKVFSNNVFVGATECTNGSYSLQVDVFSGQNDLVARVYDALDQAGPDSNIVTVTFNDAQFGQFGGHMLITSNYAKRGANPGEQLNWPIIITGGTAPYAVSVDWGDNKQPDLISVTQAGDFMLNHTYDTAGVYNVVIKGSDRNGTSAFLQVVGVANGAAQSGAQTGSGDGKTEVKTEVLWLPAVISLPLIGVAFLIGQKYELFSLRRHLEKSAESLDN